MKRFILAGVVVMGLVGCRTEPMSKVEYVDKYHVVFYRSHYKPFHISPLRLEQDFDTVQEFLDWVEEAKKEKNSIVSVVDIDRILYKRIVHPNIEVKD